MDKEVNYSEALRELEEIVAGIEEGKVTIDVLSEKVKRASYLISLCKSKLTSTEEDVKKILEEMESRSPDAEEGKEEE